ncbi:MAG: gamma-glutamyltransferase, partial [Pseudomonadota bacterium]
MWEALIEREADDGWGFILEGRVNETGYGAITTPRSLWAYQEALDRFGTMALGELMEPAIR